MTPLASCKVVPMDEVPLQDVLYSHEAHGTVILVVHAEALIADCLAAILSRAGFATLTAYDGKCAFDLAMAVPPDLLISDVGIAEIDGVQLAMAVVHALPECKVLLFSSPETSTALMHAYAAGYKFPSLPKPVHPAEILQRVMACFEPRKTEAASMR